MSTNSRTPRKPDPRVEDLIAKMTLEEKVAQLGGMGIENNVFGDVNALVFGTEANERLGIPRLIMGHAITGARSGRDMKVRSTYLCTPGAVAASWDVDLYHEVGVAMAREMRAHGQHLNLGPTINLIRHPLGGRNWECYSEDPFLTARMIVTYVRAMQDNGIICGPKHYAANNQENNRRDINNVLDERTLRETYLRAFEAAVVEGGALNVMGAYNRVNGEFSCHSTHLLKDILRNDWGFEGFVVSDFTAGVKDTVLAANAGLNVEMHTVNFYGAKLVAAVRGGQVAEATVDQLVREKLSVMFRMGIFESAYSQPKSIVRCEAHQAIALKVAQESPILLRNEGAILPLRASELKSIAVIGPNAKNPFNFKPDFPHFTHFLQGGGSGKIHYVPEWMIDPLTGVTATVGPAVQVHYHQGCSPQNKVNPELDATLRAEAVELAGRCDAAILFVGLSGFNESEERDRKTAGLPAGQDELIQAVLRANKRTVVVVIAGSYIDMNAWIDQAPGLLLCYYSGEKIGQGIADVLFGKVNPSGKLPISYPRNIEQYPKGSIYLGPPYSECGQDNVYSEGVFVGYRWFDKHNEPMLFPFGFGLSYTTFEYSSLAISPQESPVGQPVTVSLTVANTGQCAGDEIVQLYVRDIESSVDRPVRELAAFARVSLQAGQSKTVQFTLGNDAFAYYCVQRNAWHVEPGQFEVQIGASSRDIRLSGVLEKT